MRRRIVGALAAVAALTAASLASCLALGLSVPTQAPAPTAAPSTAPPPSPRPSPIASAASPVDEYAQGAQLAAALPLLDESVPVPDYRRDDFGDGWIDTDGNGCAQRQDVLSRDLTEVAVDSDGCTVLSGSLDDPYTATTIAFAHDRIGGDSEAVQIDHIVSLSAAWAGGAWSWSEADRITFANELDHLIAVDGPTNSAKGDRGPSQWMPPNATYGCLYALDYVTIAADWSLAVPASDRDALVDTLTECAA